MAHEKAEFLLAALSIRGELFDKLARCPSTEVIEALMAVWDDDANVHPGRCAHHLEPTPEGRRPAVDDAGRGMSGAARAARQTGLRYGPSHP